METSSYDFKAEEGVYGSDRATGEAKPNWAS
jgi:hypothetical protein